MRQNYLFLFFLIPLISVNAVGQPTEEGEKDPRNTWESIAQKEFTAKEKKAECQKYEGKYIGYYGTVYKVENCRRREVVNEDFVRQISRNDVNIISVDNDTIIMLPEGKGIAALNSNRKCADFEHKYVMFGEQIFFVENCKARLVPDWETYLEQRQAKGQRTEPILELTTEEYSNLILGQEYRSILDREFNRLLNGEAEVDVIPIDEACKGVEGRYVAYYSRIYKIEKCHKRQVDVARFLREYRGKELNLIELTSEQWLSLPEGKPIDRYIEDDD